MTNSPLLMIGLGNPGKEYEKTRHNIGAFVLEELAKEHLMSFKKESKVEGYVAKGIIDGQKVIFLLPTTYMNLSGQAVKKCLKYYDIPVENVIVLSDETYLPFADIRFRRGGSAGGHNGLKDIEQKLGTKEYARLRIGIGEKKTEDLADYVLSSFSKDELEQMDQIVDESFKVLKRDFLATHGQEKN